MDKVKLTKFTHQFKDLGSGRMEVICSTEDVDRDGDIIRQNGWDLKQFKNNPVVLWAHDYHSPPIAKAEKIWIDRQAKKLKSELVFADTPFAQEIYSLYQGKFLNAFSVGFISTQYAALNPDEPWAARDYQKNELLEYSCVPVPANANALVEARSKGFKVPDGLDEIAATYTEAQEALKEIGLEPAEVDKAIAEEPHEPSMDELEDVFNEDKDKIPEGTEPPETAGVTGKDIFEEPEGGEPVEGEPSADEKSGRVLSQANFDKLDQALSLLQGVIDSATPQEDATEAEVIAEPAEPAVEKIPDTDLEGRVTTALAKQVPILVGEIVEAKFRQMTGKID